MIKGQRKQRELHLNLCSARKCKALYLYTKPTEKGLCVHHWEKARQKAKMVVK